jgi:4a-hydroxytetrahydrobiopterin dehydratase
MSQLTQEKCVACRRDSPHVTPQEAGELGREVPNWRLFTENEIRQLDRVFKFPDFQRALEFTNAVGELAEQEGHHPRLVTEWGRVTVTWWTHKIRDLHRNDFIMAAKSDRIFQRIARIAAP